MARKKNPDMKIVYIALAALGGLGAAYYFTRSKSGSTTSRLTDDAAAGNGGQLLLNNASTSSYVPQSYTPTPAAGSGVVNKATGAPATPKEKQLGLNWLQALIQKNCNKSIYNPFSESDLATGSFGPKSRAALAKANEVMNAAYAALPKGTNINFFATGGKGFQGDAGLQALVTNVTAPSASVAPNAAELQALVVAAGGTSGSIGAATPSPSPAPAARTSLPAAPAAPTRETFFLRPLDASTVRGIQQLCNYVSDCIDNMMTLGSPSGLAVDVTGVMDTDTVNAYRKVLGLFSRIPSTNSATKDSYFPPDNLGLTDASQYTILGTVSDGYACRVNPKVLSFFSGRRAAKDEMGGTLQNELETVYDAMSAERWRGVFNVPQLLLTEEQVRDLPFVRGKEIVNG